MAEIKVGEYVRTNLGIIYKYTEDEKNDWQIRDFRLCNDGEIVKHSKQLIDLIEVGDIVNDCIVVEFGYECVNGNKEKSILVEGKYTKVNYALLSFDIKTILTKEQMEVNQYVVK